MRTRIARVSIRPVSIARMSIVVLAMALGFYPPVQVEGQEGETVIGSWEGTLDLPGGAGQLTVIFHVERGEDGGLTGTLDSPDQGAIGFALSSVTFDNGTLTIYVSDIDAEFTATLSEDRAMLSGTFVQLQTELPLELTKRE